MTDTTYNGWTNYETWRVNLEMFDGDYSSDNGMDAYDLGQHLRDLAIETIDGCSTGLANDYAMAFLDAVNWYQIAEMNIEAYRVEEVAA